MVKINHNSTTINLDKLHLPSALEKLSLGFEYNKTMQEIKRDVRLRTHKA